MWMCGPAAHRHPHVDRGALGVALEAGHAGAKHAVGKGPQGQTPGGPALCIATRMHLRRVSSREDSALTRQMLAPGALLHGSACCWIKGTIDKQTADKTG